MTRRALRSIPLALIACVAGCASSPVVSEAEVEPMTRLDLSGPAAVPFSMPDLFPPRQSATRSGSHPSNAVAPPSTPEVTLPIPVSFEADPHIFPASWLDDSTHVVGVRLPAKEERRTRRVVAHALAKYPAGFLKNHLEAVHVLGRLEFSGISAAGTYSHDRVYLANEGYAAGYDARYLEETFHHEFSSVLLERYSDDFPTEAWRQVNGAFAYRGSGVEAVQKGAASQDFSVAWHERGFLHEYASSALEEDFNSIAENLFGGRRQFWRVVEQYPRLAVKTRLAIEFYRSIDPAFTTEWFKTLTGPIHE